jgi:AbrB family looped-hinge helix DNA binding protein
MEDNPMAMSKVSAKGQIVIPKEIRTKMNLSPGDRVEIEATQQGIVILPVKKSYTEFYKGIVKGSLSLADLEELHGAKHTI